MKGDSVPPLPHDAPQPGEVYRHYKGDNYKVLGVALNSDDTWQVVYEAMYDNPAAKLFTRPLREWREIVAWEGREVERFTKVPKP
jgi:hypothetical protein